MDFRSAILVGVLCYSCIQLATSESTVPLDTSFTQTSNTATATDAVNTPAVTSAAATDSNTAAAATDSNTATATTDNNIVAGTTDSNTATSAVALQPSPTASIQPSKTEDVMMSSVAINTGGGLDNGGSRAGSGKDTLVFALCFGFLLMLVVVMS